MNLKYLTDKNLLSDLKILVQQEREVITQVLHHLKEVERRKLFSELGYPSMLAYAIKELNYSESSANKRIQAARMLAEMPEIEEKINHGVLSLSNLSKANGFFKNEKIKDIKKKKNILEKIENKTTRECEKTLFSLGTTIPLPGESIRVVSANYQQIKINISDDTFDLLNEAKSLLDCFCIDDQFFNKLSKMALENIKRYKFKLTEKGRITESDSRYVTNSQKREAYEKSNGVCSKCGSLFMIQFDHRIPYSLGGKSAVGNVRLLCYHCNQRARINSKL